MIWRRILNTRKNCPFGRHWDIFSHSSMYPCNFYFLKAIIIILKSKNFPYLAQCELALDVCSRSILENIWRLHLDFRARCRFPFLVFSNYRQVGILSSREQNTLSLEATLNPFLHTNLVIARSAGPLARKLFLKSSCWSILTALLAENLYRPTSGRFQGTPTRRFQFG